MGKLASVKLSVSLPDDDVEFLDSYAKAQGIESRSAAVHKAVGLLRASELEAAYEEAFDEWVGSGEAELWDVTAGDGIDASG
jgi:Arc/MetJ-type ribon-helix-helix transcriptional regulator